jgi:hypothetical protein
VPRRRNAATLRRRIGVALLAAGAACAAPALGAVETCPIPSGDSPPAETAESLRDRQTWEHEAAQRLPPRTLEPARVAAILAAIEPPPREASLWDRFVAWLDGWFKAEEQGGEAPAWLLELIERIPKWLGPALFFGSLAALVIALATIIVIELRAAGVFRRRAGVAGTPAATAAALAAAPAAGLELAGIGALPLREQPAALLLWAIRRLVARHVLPADRSLTNGELLALVGTRAPDELPVFRRLARAAEAVVYGARDPAERETRELLEALRTPAGAAP